MKKLLIAMALLVSFSNVTHAENVNQSDQMVVLEQNNATISVQKQPLTDLPNEGETKRNWFCVNS